MSKKSLADFLKKKGFLESESVYKAFLSIDRKDFVPSNLKSHAYEDAPLSIGEGQTISQPSVVAFMMEKLMVEEGQNILDIGCGSGWTTALLAQITSDGKKENSNGKVTAIEIIPELKEFGEKNVSKYDFINNNIVKIFCYDGYKGFLQEAPYDRILVSAALPEIGGIPFSWKEQVKENGVIVVPIENSIFKLVKKEGTFIQEEYFGFSFVPLVKNEN